METKARNELAKVKSQKLINPVKGWDMLTRAKYQDKLASEGRHWVEGWNRLVQNECQDKLIRVEGLDRLARADGREGLVRIEGRDESPRVEGQDRSTWAHGPDELAQNKGQFWPHQIYRANSDWNLVESTPTYRTFVSILTLWVFLIRSVLIL